MSLAGIEAMEKSLWEAADQLRANSKLTSSEYCMPVLGVIFLRHATNRFNAALRAIEADQAAGRIPKRALVKADFVKRRALMLPDKARYDAILQLPKGTNLGKALIAAMDAIEAEFEPLKSQLPREYDRFENSLLEDLLRIFDREELRVASGDVFGRIYEYFLQEFAMQGAQDNGEFFTPPSIVNTIVNVIEPEHGKVFDPACGSGGMFVQSSHFIERMGQDTAHRVTFFGQEKTATTIRLAKMNLAVHGLEGDIREANTFYEDVHDLFAKCDFVMANPPFNVDMVDAEKVKNDRRLPFGLPGVNKEKKVSNGNYLWISYFHSYLGPKGRAGFVMSSQASSAGHTEAEVRRKIVETGDVDVMVAIRSNFFYTRTVPCELWHFDKGKPKERRDQVLMIDARQVFRKVTRKIYDFSPEQLANLTAIVWLHRGQQDRFLGLVRSYFDRLSGAIDAVPDSVAAIEVARQELAEHLQQVHAQVRSNGPETLTHKEQLGAALEALRPSIIRGADGAGAVIEALQGFGKKQRSSPATTNKALHAGRESFGPLSARARELIRRLQGLQRSSTHAHRAGAALVKGEEQASTLGVRNMKKYADAFHEAVGVAVERLRDMLHVYHQIVWLQDRFPKAEIEAVPGLCKVVTRKEIEQADWSLTPGRYVGVAPPEVDEDFDFEQAVRDIHTELADLNAEASGLATKIQASFEELIG
jgi:type I restriction enzyme M protein